MLIQKLELKNFKRFTDLTIDLSGEKETPKLVLLIGANGSGKSCVFDAFETINKLVKQNYQEGVSGFIQASDYSKKGNTFGIKLQLDNSQYFNLTQTNNVSNINKSIDFESDSFYGRTAFRYTPRITKTTIGTTTNTTKDDDRPLTFSDFDKRFENDWDTFIYNQLQAYGQDNPNVKANFINQLNLAFESIFGLNDSISLKYVDFGLPRDGLPLEFNFKKGSSDIEYKNLSAGEKMVFEILFNLVARERTYNKDSIIFLDEIDLHLNTSLQKNLLKEINENWLGDNQVWVASHSLGFIQYATEYDRGVVIDLDNLDFDDKQTLVPSDGNSRSVMELALGSEFLNRIEDDLEQDKNQNLYPVFSEGYNKNYLKLANKILGYNLPLYFIDGGGKNNLKQHFGSIKTNHNLTFHLFDCDVDILKTKSENSRYVLKLPKNKDSFATKGIENCFDKELITQQNRADFYRLVVGDYGQNEEKSQKNLFEDFVLDRNNPEDFVNFRTIFEEINNIINNQTN